jgi:CelD/BcsL family acetyltransferase involved in cellulose biosynthesis
VPRAIEACHELPWPFEAFNLWETPVESPLWRAVERGALAGLRPLERKRAPRYLIDLPSSFDTYLGHFSGKSRATLLRKARRLEELAGPLSVRPYVRPGEMASWLQTIAPVFLKTYHHHLLGLNLTSDNLELLRNLEHCARHGWVRSYVLFAGERPIAYVQGYLAGRQFRYEMPGYDPELGEHSPGLVLLLRLIEDLIGDGAADVVDFGSGDQEYKKLFSTRSYLEVSALLVRSSPRARGTAAIYGALAGASRLGTRLLERHGIKKRMLSWLRRRRPEGGTQPTLGVTPPRPESPIVVVPASPPRPRAVGPSRAAPPPTARPAGTASTRRRTDR